MNGRELTLLFPGTFRDEFLDVKFPEFDGSAVQVTLDRLFCPANLVPCRYDKGSFFFVQGDDFAPSTLMCVFKLHGDATADDCMKVIGKWTHDLNLDPEKYHVSMRTLGDDKMRLFVYRIYMNVEGECFEHPEMLTGAPIGQYHCPCCDFMVIAGVPHPTKAQIEEFEKDVWREIQKDITGETSEWEAGDAECLDPQYTDEQVAILNADFEKEMKESHERKALFDKCFRSCQTAYEHYQTLEDDWDGNGSQKPTPENMKVAFDFMMFACECADFTVARAAIPMLDHEGIPGLFWPSVDGKNYVSLAFYEHQIVYFIKDASEHNGTSGTLNMKSGEVVEDILLKIINVWPNEKRMEPTRKIKFREQRGGLTESMETIVEIEPTHAALVEHLQKLFSSTGEDITKESVISKRYGEFDTRIGWDTYVVLLKKSDGYDWIMGFHDGPLQDYIYAV